MDWEKWGRKLVDLVVDNATIGRVGSTAKVVFDMQSDAEYFLYLLNNSPLEKEREEEPR